MWVFGSYVDYYEHTRALPPAGAVLAGEGVYALGLSRLPTREVDGVVPAPGQDSRQELTRYAVTGVVSSPVRMEEHSTLQEFLLVAGGARLVARSTLKAAGQVSLGERCTLECRFELVAGVDWSLFDLPEAWAGHWRIEEIRPVTFRGWDFVLDLTGVGPSVSEPCPRRR